VYRATFHRVREQNSLFFDRYPDAQELSDSIADRLAASPVTLPNGDALTPRRFQQLGISFGSSDGFEQIYYLLERAMMNPPDLSLSFLRAVEGCGSFDTNPLYAILHEAIYCQETASNWSAHRIRDEFPEFQYETGRPLRFTGEMVYPWMFEEYGQLAPIREAANILAARDDWPRLYDIQTLGKNSVPAAAVVYYDDMYVERPFSEESARKIPGLKLWITNQYEHNGLRADGERILDRLIAMVRGYA